MKSKFQDWWDSLSPQMQEYLKNQPIWYDNDLYKFGFLAFAVGLVVGFLVGYEVAWEPAIQMFKPLIG